MQTHIVVKLAFMILVLIAIQTAKSEIFSVPPEPLVEDVYDEETSFSTQPNHGNSASQHCTGRCPGPNPNSCPFSLRTTVLHNGTCSVQITDFNKHLNIDPHLNCSALLCKLISDYAEVDHIDVQAVPISVVADGILCVASVPKVPTIGFGISHKLTCETLQILSPEPSLIRLNPESDCELVPPLHLYLEKIAPVDGSLNDIVDRKIPMSLTDFVYILWGYYHDLARFLQHASYVPADAHAGNLMYERVGLHIYWTDFYFINDPERAKETQINMRSLLIGMSSLANHPGLQQFLEEKFPLISVYESDPMTYFRQCLRNENGGRYLSRIFVCGRPSMVHPFCTLISHEGPD